MIAKRLRTEMGMVLRSIAVFFVWNIGASLTKHKKKVVVLVAGHKQSLR